jgi:diguanylate cyclase (GGDEF)-like protein
MSRGLTELSAKIGKFLEYSCDGYGIFDKDDILIACNKAFADIFEIPHDDIINKSFTDIVQITFHAQKGIKIDSTDIELWLSHAKSRRRSQEFRVFEVDLMDGRWFLLSEQTLADGEMLIHARDITKLKINEKNLSDSTVKLRTLALTDELTQIANRRSFIESVKTEISRCQRQHAAMAFLLLDIDNFKIVNDTYGHLAGDQVLIFIAKLIKTMLREYDIFGRLGGEEFGIFLAETSPQTAHEVAERIRETIMQQNIEADRQIVKVTLSIGISLATQDCKFESLYKNADRLLYEAKHAGRNKVMLANKAD